nr:MAG TPA: Repressor protein CI [Caudoviricetes sp.]DAS69345.1 MAG TPA: Repressor protein CI [Caudoviricetes sp.]
MNILGKTIKKIRVSRGLTQVQLSKLTGLRQNTISNHENGNRSLDEVDINIYAQALGVSPKELFEAYQDDNNNITTIYNQLNSDRKEKVYNFATEQLNEQNNKIRNINDYIEEEADWYEVKFYGSISAGTGLYLDDEQVETINFSSNMVPNGTDFCLKVNGDSMEPTFNNGDYVFIKRETDFRNGTIGAVIVNGEAYLKKIYITDNSIRLVSLNKKYKDIIVSEDDTLKYVGTVVF